jgi:phospholipid/cholesterol/gamma-HCH transport system substrate-binding protein
METKAHHVLIGAFVLLALIGGLMFALWIAKVQLDSEYDEYDVLFKERVTGLAKGGLVNFNGIQVGEVRRLKLDKTDPSQVIARIRVDAATPVKADTIAKLTHTGLTGVVVIELEAGEPDAPPMPIPAGAEVAVIVATPSAFQKLMNEGEDILVRVNDTLDNVKKMLSNENADRVTRTLTHIEAIAAQVDVDKAALGPALRRADVALANVGDAASEVKKFAANGSGTLARADRVLEEDIGPAAEDLKRTLKSLRAVSAKLDGLLGRNGKQLDQFAQQGIPGLTATLEDLRSLIKNLDRVAARMDKGPADYLLQRDRPREYRAK